MRKKNIYKKTKKKQVMCMSGFDVDVLFCSSWCLLPLGL